MPDRRPTPVGSPPALDWGVSVRMLPGESATGDAFVVAPRPGGMLVAVIDGLGHGAEAAAPAQAAKATIARNAGDALPILVRRCHDALLGTRGIVLSLAAFDFTDRTMTWLGIGDVAGVLVFHDPAIEPRRATLIHRGGIVGSRLPLARPWVIPLADRDTLVFATDGVRSEFEAALPIAGSPQQVADEIMARFCKGTDDALVLAARFLDTSEGLS